MRKRVERGEGGRDRQRLPSDRQGPARVRALARGPGRRGATRSTYDFLLGHPFLTKCLFFGSLTPDEVRAKLADQLADCTAKLETFEAIRARMVERGVDTHRIAVLDLGIAQQKEKERWLKRMIRESTAAQAPKAA